jgi:hypothetical protein
MACTAMLCRIEAVLLCGAGVASNAMVLLPGIVGNVLSIRFMIFFKWALFLKSKQKILLYAIG